MHKWQMTLFKMDSHKQTELKKYFFHKKWETHLCTMTGRFLGTWVILLMTLMPIPRADAGWKRL